MAVEATGSTFSRNTRIYLAVICFAGAVWFGYDGWFGEYKDKELEKNDGQPSVNLYVNRYAPIPLALVALFSLITGLKVTSKKIVADDQGLTIDDEKIIPYSDMKKIDKTKFDKAGYFLIEYEEAQTLREVKISDRQYNNLGLILDEIIRQTGAAPEKPSAQENS